MIVQVSVNNTCIEHRGILSPGYLLLLLNFYKISTHT